MFLRCLLVLALVALQLGACANDRRNKPAVDDMERQHEQQMIRMGGGSSGGGM